MRNSWKHYRYFILRRAVQLGLLSLFVAANFGGLKVLTGNYSAARVMSWFTLTDPYAFLQMLATGFIAALDLWVGLSIVVLFYAFVGGRAFCSWVCPLNIVTDTASWLHRKTARFDGKADIQLSRNARYWIAGMGLVLSSITGVAAFELVSPISMLHRGVVFGFGFGWAAVLMVFLFDWLILKHGWCGHICPLGATYSLVGKYNVIKVSYDEPKCTRCTKCLQFCPEKQVLAIVGKKSGIIGSGECTNCGKCIEVCDDDALRFKLVQPFRKEPIISSKKNDK